MWWWCRRSCQSCRTPRSQRASRCCRSPHTPPACDAYLPTSLTCRGFSTPTPTTPTATFWRFSPPTLPLPRRLALPLSSTPPRRQPAWVRPMSSHAGALPTLVRASTWKSVHRTVLLPQGCTKRRAVSIAARERVSNQTNQQRNDFRPQ